MKSLLFVFSFLLFSIAAKAADQIQYYRVIQFPNVKSDCEQTAKLIGEMVTTAGHVRWRPCIFSRSKKALPAILTSLISLPSRFQSNRLSRVTPPPCTPIPTSDRIRA